MNMVGLLMILGVLCACHTTPQYVIKGKLANYSGKVFLITSSLNGKSDTLAFANVKNGVFELKGEVQEPILASLQTEKKNLKIPVFLENTEFTLETDKIALENCILTGGELQALREKFRREVEDSIRMQRDVLLQEYRDVAKVNDRFGMSHVRALMANLDSEYENRENAFLRENDNIVAVSLLQERLTELLRGKKLRSKFELLGNIAKSSLIGKELASYVSRELSVGGIAPDFTLKNPEGELISLYSIKAKVKILDFWASWCAPCRAENPNVKKVYEKYHDVGLEILSVSLDNKKERWIEAIKQDGLPWIHVSDLLGWECAAAKLYGIRGIPRVIVLDEDNRIVATGLRGKELEECVSKVLLK